MPNTLQEEFASSHIAWYWGFLAESTNTPGQRRFHVYVPDLTPFRNGDVNATGSIVENDLFNVMTQSREKVKTHMSQTVIAEYLGFESSREAPDMYKGQQVMLMTYGCGDKWFWLPLERDDYIKTFEHVKFRAADIALVHKTGEDEPDENQSRLKDLHDDNTYFFEIDTKYHKHIMLSTAGTDGEKYRYFFKIDANEHTVEIWDGLVDKSDKLFGAVLPVPHNTIKIESDPILSQGKMLKGRITLQNEAGTTLILEDVDAKLVVPRDLTFEVGRNWAIHTGQDTAITTTGDLHVKVFGNMWKMVHGFIKKHVIGPFSYLFECTKTEEIGLADKMNGVYTRLVNGQVVEKANMEVIDVNTTYTVNSIGPMMMYSKATAVFGAAQLTTINQGQKLAFVAKNIVTTTHIFGCCGCSGH